MELVSPSQLLTLGNEKSDGHQEQNYIKPKHNILMEQKLKTFLKDKSLDLEY